MALVALRLLDHYFLPMDGSFVQQTFVPSETARVLLSYAYFLKHNIDPEMGSDWTQVVWICEIRRLSGHLMGSIALIAEFVINLFNSLFCSEYDRVREQLILHNQLLEWQRQRCDDLDAVEGVHTQIIQRLLPVVQAEVEQAEAGKEQAEQWRKLQQVLQSSLAQQQADTSAVLQQIEASVTALQQLCAQERLQKLMPALQALRTLREENEVQLQTVRAEWKELAQQEDQLQEALEALVADVNPDRLADAARRLI